MKLKIHAGTLTPDVPQEIVDLIIDNLQDDPLALRACTLTAHNWVHRSRRHLHSRVRIGEYYINLNRYSCPQTASYVRELDLYMVRTTRGRQRTTTDRLWEMVERFPNLKSLIIRDFEFYRLSPQRYALLRNICAKLHTLELHHVQFADPVDFLSFIGSCVKLRSFYIEDGQFYDPITATRVQEMCRNLFSELKREGKPLPGSGLRTLTIGTLSSSSDFEKMTNSWVAALTRDGLLNHLTLSKDVPDNCAGHLAAVGSSPIDLCVSRCNIRMEKPGIASSLCCHLTFNDHMDYLVQTGIEHCTNIRSLSFIQKYRCYLETNSGYSCSPYD